MSKRILLISGNFSPEPTGIGKYSGEMVEWLAENGNACTVITTFPYYPEWKVQQNYARSRFWFKIENRLSQNGLGSIKIIRCPHYVPHNPSGFKRLLSEFTISFSAYIALLVLLFTKCYAHVITVAPPFELGLLGVLYKKIRKASFIYHIQDLQIDAARELGMIKSPRALKTLVSIENYIIKNADYISTISEGMIRKVKLKTDKDIILFPNWVNTGKFYPIENREHLKEQFGFERSDRIVLYSGAIGVKQGLEAVIHSARVLRKLENVKFVICGCGPYMHHLEEYKRKLDADNVVFLPLQSAHRLNSFLNMADLHLIIQKSNASDLVMPSKLSTILAVGGVPIVTASSGSGLYNIMQSSDMGFVIEPENPAALHTAILDALNTDLSIKRKNSREYASAHLSGSEVLPSYFTNVLISKRSIIDDNRMRDGSIAAIATSINNQN